MSGHVVEVLFQLFIFDSTGSDLFRKTRCRNSFEEDQACSQVIAGMDTTFCIDIDSFYRHVIAMDWERSFWDVEIFRFVNFFRFFYSAREYVGRIFHLVFAMYLFYFHNHIENIALNEELYDLGSVTDLRVILAFARVKGSGVRE